ncbi:hypothetical protein ACFS6H_20645 [Terrimonas rubra]|uniref:YD repeat-containing protein n=1 Tax=Terrimonas rubra TaxID=1035890 RepID=A0ABW6ABW1_9BACT
MKTLLYFYLLFFSITFLPSCKKDKDTPAAKKVMMTKTITTKPGQAPFTIIYNYDAAGQLVSYKYDNITVTTITRNANGQVTKTTDANATTGVIVGGVNFYYDAAGKCIKRESLSSSGSVTFYYTFTYQSNMFVSKQYNPAGSAGEYFESYYTADGKNIQSRKLYTNTGTLKSIYTYQYDTKYGTELAMPFSDISPIVPTANNVIAYTSSIVPGATTNYSYTYAYNNDGYPVKRVSNDGTETTFEYVSW